MRVVFGDEDGWIFVCESTSGDVRFKWHAQPSKVICLAVRTEDGMIVTC